MQHVRQSHQVSPSSYVNWNARDDFFTYTRGRFLRDEQYETSQRSVRFNMKELARIAAESVGAEMCVSVEKFPDGIYNKAFLFTMQDGVQVVGRVPNPNAGPPRYTTASEVATMDFVSVITCFPRPESF